MLCIFFLVCSYMSFAYCVFVFFFFKQKTAYEMRISDWSSDVCSSDLSVCWEIDEGRFVDLIEIDAASRTKVEDTRELLDNVQYAPSRGRFKVYQIGRASCRERVCQYV